MASSALPALIEPMAEVDEERRILDLRHVDRLEDLLRFVPAALLRVELGEVGLHVDVGRFLLDHDLHVLDGLVEVLLALVGRGHERVQPEGRRILGDQILDDLAGLGDLARLLELDRLLHAGLELDVGIDGRRGLGQLHVDRRIAVVGDLDRHPLRIEAVLGELEVPAARGQAGHLPLALVVRLGLHRLWSRRP